jgi:hypothetical protein
VNTSGVVANIGADVERRAAIDSSHHALDQSQTAFIVGAVKKNLCIDDLFKVEPDTTAIQPEYHVSRDDLPFAQRAERGQCEPPRRPKPASGGQERRGKASGLRAVGDFFVGRQ